MAIYITLEDHENNIEYQESEIDDSGCAHHWINEHTEYLNDDDVVVDEKYAVRMEFVDQCFVCGIVLLDSEPINQ